MRKPTDKYAASQADVFWRKKRERKGKKFCSSRGEIIKFGAREKGGMRLSGNNVRDPLGRVGGPPVHIKRDRGNDGKF